MRDVLRSISEQLGERSAVSRHVQSVIVVGYVLIGVPYNVARLGGSPVFWLTAMLASQVLIVASLGNLASLQPRLRPRALRATFALLIYAAWGTVSALLMALVGVATGPTDDHILAERITVGVLFAVPVGIAGAVAIGSHRRHRELVDALETELEQLRRSLASAEADIAATRAKLRSAISTDLLPRLNALREGLGGSGGGTAAATLHQQVAADVRGLAHRLAEEAQPWRPPARPPARRGRAVGLLAPAATLVRPVSPVTMTVILVILAVVWTGRIVGPETAIRSVVAAPWLLIVLWLGEQGMALVADRSVPVRAAALTAIFALASVWGALAGTTPELQALFTWAILIVGIGLGWTLALAHAWDERRRILLRDLEVTIASVDHAIARTNQRLRLERDRLARIVHGPIQDRLVAAGQRLAAATQEGDAAVRDVAALLDEAEQLAQLQRPEPIDLPTLLDGIAAVWQGIAAVTYTVDPRVTALLAHDDAAAETAAEIVREGVSNAVRHGRSRLVVVVVTPRCEQAFIVEVLGDGAAAGERTKVGLGTRYLEAATLEWQLERGDGNGSRLRAVVPWAASHRAPSAGGLWRP